LGTGFIIIPFHLPSSLVGDVVKHNGSYFTYKVRQIGNKYNWTKINQEFGYISDDTRHYSILKNQEAPNEI